jgi:hypothetical protein
MTFASRIGSLGVGLSAFVSGRLRAKSDAIAVDDAPQAWVAYATRVSMRFHAALDGDSDAAQRFHAYLEQQAVHDADDVEAPPALSVRTWLDARGQITRVEFNGLDSDAAEADLRALLLAQSIDAPPPRDMKQPVVVRLGFVARS